MSVPAEAQAEAAERPVRRLNWGCGSHIADGWINSDAKDEPGVDLVADILEGLPIEEDAVDYAVSIHALPELPYPKIVPALEELRRVLRPGGTLRLVLPDLRKGIRAYMLGNDDYFLPGDDDPPVKSRGGRFIVHMLWYGYSRTLFTADFATELLEQAGFERVTECRFGETASPFPDITSLDNREEESLFIEAQAPKDAGSRLRRGNYNRRRRMKRRRVLIEGVEVVQAKPDAGVRGRVRAVHDDNGEGGLRLRGWVLGDEKPVRQVQVTADGEEIGEAPVSVSRPDIAEAFPESPGAANSGFDLVLDPEGAGESELDVSAVLADETKVPLCTVKVRTARARRRLFRRS